VNDARIFAGAEALARAVLCGVVLLAASTSSLAASRFAIASGNWNTAAVWTNSGSGCAGAAAGGVPGNGDTIIICAGVTVTFNVASVQIRDLTVQSGATLQGSATNGTVQIGAGGGEDLSVLGTLNFGSATPALLQFNKGVQWGCTDIFAGVTSCGSTTLSVLDLNNQNLVFAAGTTFTINLTGANPIIDSANGWKNPAVTSLSTITWNFNGAVAQTMATPPGGKSPDSVRYGNITVNNTAGVTLGVAFETTNLIGNLRIQTGTLKDGGFSITGTAGKTFQIAAGATFQTTRATQALTGFGTFDYGTTAPCGTYDYALGGAQTVVATPPNYGNLSLSVSGAKTMPVTALTVACNFTMSGSASASSGNTLAVGQDFILSGTSRFTAGAAVTVTRDMTLGSGTSFSAGSFTHNIGRDFTNDGTTFTAGTSTFNFNGSAAQVIGGSASTTFNRLTIANTSGDVALAKDETVSTLLTLTSGIVSTGANTLITTANCTSPSVTRTGGHVAGFLRLRVPAGSPSCTFDVGDGTTYRPIGLVFSSGTTAGDLTGSVSQSAGEHPNVATAGIDGTADVNRYWTLTNGGVGLGAGGYAATFTFVSADVDAGASATLFEIERWTGSWNATTAGTRTSTSTQATGIAGFGDFISGMKKFGASNGSFNAFETATAAGTVTGVINTKVAGTAFSLDVVAIVGGAQAGFFSNNVTVELIGNNTTGVSLDASNCPTSFSTVLAGFTAAISGGRSTVSFSAVANSWRDVRVRVRWPTASPTVTSCSTDNFAIRPASLTISALDAAWDAAGTARSLANTGASGGVVHKAATAATQRPFTLRATASPATTTNYDGSPTVASGYPACGTLCATPGSLSFTAGSWTGAGVRENATANYSEAGTFNLQLEDASYASVDASDGSTAAQRTVPAAATVEIGRFVPDRFEFASPNAPQLRTFASTCASRSFTYIGQRFWFATLPSATAKAVNAAGGTTTNYPIASSATKPALGESFADGSAPATLDTSAVGSGALSSPSAGTATYAPSSSGTLGYQRSATTPVAPFSAAIALTVTASDSSENGANQGIITTPTALVFSSMAFDSGSEFRYGRMRMLNATGPAAVDVPVTLRAEYYAGASGFAVNAADQCSAFVPGNFKLSGHQGGITTTNMPDTNVSVSGTLAFGVASNLKLLKPSPAASAPGSVKICLDLDNGAGDTACVAATPADRAYLQGPWSGSNHDKDPQAQVTFGLYGSQPRNFIFQRENF
jgi:MSHA biogenesis protein MshQ